MAIFLTLGVYSLNVSNGFPLQSDYIPIVNIYFFLGILYTFFSFCWFILVEYLRGLPELPIVFTKISKLICIGYLEKNKIKNEFDIELNNNNNNVEILNIKCEVPNKSEFLMNKQESLLAKEKKSCTKALNISAFCILFLAQFISYFIVWTYLAVNHS